MTTWQTPPELAAQLKDLYGLHCPPRWGTMRCLERETIGPKIAEVAKRMGVPGMPHQRYVWDVLGEIDPDTGGLWYRRGGVLLGRQNGKTHIGLALGTHRMAAYPRQKVMYTAQTRDFATRRLVDEFQAAWKRSKWSDARSRHWTTNGKEHTMWVPTGSTWQVMANTVTAGHGPPNDLGLLDEFFAQKDNRLEQALSPAQSTRPMGQLIWLSAQGDESSIPLQGKITVGRAAVEAAFTGQNFGSHLAYFEWSPEEWMPQDSEDTWRSCMPALCPAPPCRCDPEGEWRHITLIDAIRADCDDMDPDEFARAYLCRLRESKPSADPHWDVAAFDECADANLVMGRDMVLAVEVEVNRKSAAIVAYGPSTTGVMMGEVVTQRPGVEWVPPVLVKLARLRDPLCIVVDKASAGGAQIERLHDLGIEDGTRDDVEAGVRGRLLSPNGIQIAAASGALVDAWRAGTFGHLGQEWLNTAVTGAKSKTGTRGAFVLDTRKSVGKVAALQALVLAWWGWGESSSVLEVSEYDPVAAIW